jgi:hypothetical protein
MDCTASVLPTPGRPMTPPVYASCACTARMARARRTLRPNSDAPGGEARPGRRAPPAPPPPQPASPPAQPARTARAASPEGPARRSGSTAGAQLRSPRPSSSRLAPLAASLPQAPPLQPPTLVCAIGMTAALACPSGASAGPVASHSARTLPGPPDLAGLPASRARSAPRLRLRASRPRRRGLRSAAATPRSAARSTAGETPGAKLGPSAGALAPPAAPAGSGSGA